MEHFTIPTLAMPLSAPTAMVRNYNPIWLGIRGNQYRGDWSIDATTGPERFMLRQPKPVYR